jgi:hypothetical protein
MYLFDPKLINLPSAFIKRIFIISLVILCGACAAPKEKPVEQAKEKIVVPMGDQYWTLDFTYFYKGKETQTVISQYEHRRDCFEAMFKLQKEASQKPYSSGGGLCKKLFVDGQERTHKDQLGYR